MPVTIDPKVGVYLSIALAILAFLAGAGATLTDLFGEHTTKLILAVITLILGIGNSINAVLHAIPTNQPPKG